MSKLPATPSGESEPAAKADSPGGRTGTPPGRRRLGSSQGRFKTRADARTAAAARAPARARPFQGGAATTHSPTPVAITPPYGLPNEAMASAPTRRGREPGRPNRKSEAARTAQGKAASEISSVQCPMTSRS